MDASSVTGVAVGPVDSVPVAVTATGPVAERLVDAVARRDPRATALVIPDDGSVVTYGQLQDSVDDLAARLAALGVRRGDTVSLALPNGPEIVALVLATALLGAAAAPLNPAYTEDELRFYLGDLQPRVLLLPTGDLAGARRAAGDALTVVDVEPRTVALSRGGATVDPRPPSETAEPGDIALLLHTSGTTSRPKQVPLLHRNVASSARSLARHFTLGPDDVAYCAMPLFHVHGLIGCVLSTLVAGGSVIVPRRLRPAGFWRHLDELGPTWFSAVPTIYHALLGRDPDAGRHGRALRFLRSASSPLPPALLERIEDRFGVPMLEAYGMTEGSHQIAANPLPPGRRVAGSVGVSAGSDVAVLAEDGARVADGTPGEIAIKGPAVTPGYLNAPEANEAAFVDGWLRTGDHGIVEDGYVFLQGRLKELINRGGEKISPYEVEAVLLDHAAVAEAVCFAIPDPKYGEQIGAAVRLRADATAKELVEHCRRGLASFKAPSTIHVLDAIPRTATGKVQRSRMHDLLGG